MGAELTTTRGVEVFAFVEQEPFWFLAPGSVLEPGALVVSLVLFSLRFVLLGRLLWTACCIMVAFAMIALYLRLLLYHYLLETFLNLLESFHFWARQVFKFSEMWRTSVICLSVPESLVAPCHPYSGV